MQSELTSETACSIAAAKEDAYLPERMLIQWHLTERCNLRCSHCYQDEEPPPDPSWDELMHMLDQIRSFTLHIRQLHKGKRFRAHITVTGGEPFIRPDFIDLLTMISKDEAGFSFGILTNGTLLSPGLVRQIHNLGAGFVQVSIDGTRKTHEMIRGSGSYDAAVEGIRMLRGERIPVHISFTASRRNLGEFSHVADIGRRLGVERVWSDRMVPCGRAASGSDGAMTPEETRQYVSLMHNERRRSLLRRSPVSLIRALQFTKTGDQPYRCSAGETLVTILPDGAVCPCRRMPIPVGNILRDGLIDIYGSSWLFRRLRDRSLPSRGCEGCFYSETCGGGARCISNAVYGDPFMADPGCWLSSHNPASRSKTIHCI